MQGVDPIELTMTWVSFPLTCLVCALQLTQTFVICSYFSQRLPEINYLLHKQLNCSSLLASCHAWPLNQKTEHNIEHIAFP